MASRIAILFVVVVAILLLWPAKARAFLGLAGMIAVIVAVGFFIVVLINLPAPQ